jgi:hypothetical protein
LDRIHKGAAICNQAKLNWFSEQHFRGNIGVHLDEMVKELKPLLEEKLKEVKQVRDYDDKYIALVIKTIAVIYFIAKKAQS